MARAIAAPAAPATQHGAPPTSGDDVTNPTTGAATKLNGHGAPSHLEVVITMTDELILLGSISEALSERAQALIVDGVAPNTRRAYSRQREAFRAWCTAAQRSSLPCTSETLAEYVVSLIDAGQAPASIEQAIATIRTMHRLAGHPGQPATGQALSALRGCKRARGKAGVRQRKAPPITIKDLRKMIEVTDGTTPAGARDRLLLVLGMAMMGRRSELVALHLADIREVDEGLAVLIRASKTDQEGVGQTVAVPRGAHPATDPVRLYRIWLDILGGQGIIDGPVLRSVSRHGKIGAALSTVSVNKIVRRLATSANLPNPETYTAHSLRAGGATEAFRSGKPISVVAEHGRWRNLGIAAGYIRETEMWTNNAVGDIGL